MGIIDGESIDARACPTACRRMERMNGHMSLWKRLLFALGGVVAITLIAGGSYFLYRHGTNSQDTPVPPQPQVISPAPSTSVTPDSTTLFPPVSSFGQQPQLPPADRPQTGMPPVGATPTGPGATPGIAPPGTQNPGTPGSAATSQPRALKLTTEQQARIKSIDDETKTRVEAISKDTTLSDDEKRAAIFIALQQAQLRKQDLLTPEQRAAFTEEMVARRNALEDRLKMTAEQRRQVNSLNDKADDEVEAVLRNTSLSDVEKQKEIFRIRETCDKQTEQLLTPAQRKQVLEDSKKAQQAVAGATAKALGLTAAQRAEIQAITDEATKKVQEILKDTTLSKEEKQARVREIQADLNAQTMKLLTPAQQQTVRDWEKKAAARRAEANK